MENPPIIKERYSDESFSIMIEMLGNGEMKKIQDDYLYWNKVKYRTNHENKIDVWMAVKLHRTTNSKSIFFGKYKFTYPNTDFIQRTLHLFDLHIGGTLGSNIGIAETDKTKFMISSIMEEAISSSQMEGANTTRKKAKEMIQQEQKPRTKSEQMIMNNFVTMRHITQYKHENLTPENLLRIHKLISSKTLENPGEEGRFRANDDIFVQDIIKGENIHQPPPHEELEQLIGDLCLFFNTDTNDFIHPIIKGCIIHFMIGWIHPFSDGNGRTARTLFYWYMLKNGYWLTEYLSISRIIKDTKNQYEKAYLYSEKDDNDLGYFITYNIKTMIKAFDALKDYIGRKQREVVQAAKFMKIPGVNDRMAQILKIIYDDSDRVLNSKEVEKRFSISNFTARQDLKNLVELGFLEVVQVNKIKQNFIKSKNFEQELKKINK
ncbi:Fic family protein [Fluviicola sp.]|jgi:Fic family protein|uniref:Fic family protein n=1 Tax=Fluviicola sp. TaxID=1917219 RepID=UPI0028277C12|nr:Fic family protein [Fluviicola sp.]MDR0801743.1 Fic family protein [Fluviicola sp.]